MEKTTVAKVISKLESVSGRNEIFPEPGHLSIYLFVLISPFYGKPNMWINAKFCVKVPIQSSFMIISGPP